MKTIEFDLEKAKSGEYEIVTKNGASVRIICWDKQDGDFKLVGLVKDTDGYEFCQSYDEHGDAREGDTSFDLRLVTDDAPVVDDDLKHDDLSESLKEKYDYYARCIDDANVLLGAIEHLEETPIVKAVRRVLKFEEIEVAEENMERLRYGIEHGREHEHDLRDGDFVADEHSIMLLKEYVEGTKTQFPYVVVYAAYNRQNEEIFAFNKELKAYSGRDLTFATESEKEFLIGEINKRGYEWNSETKELVILNENKNENN